ncbi:MAG TPA: TOBE domain-containing protein, partial [Pirellulales bacterium]|nr:TOBE domain-containing protein [Pirellulales bacterium]
EVRRLADRVVVIEAGSRVAEGSPKEALVHPSALAWRGALGPMNLLRVDDVREEKGQWMGNLAGECLHLPPLRNPRTKAWVQVDPDDVLLSGGDDVAPLSARNRLRGIVEQIIHAAGSVYVAVDVGQTLWAHVTPQAAWELELHVGNPVTCIIKTHSLRVAE